MAVQLWNTFPGRLDTSPWTTLTIFESMNHVFSSSKIVRRDIQNWNCGVIFYKRKAFHLGKHSARITLTVVRSRAAILKNIKMGSLFQHDYPQHALISRSMEGIEHSNACAGIPELPGNPESHYRFFSTKIS